MSRCLASEYNIISSSPNSRVSGLSRLSRHEREVVGEELSGHSVHEAWKVQPVDHLDHKARQVLLRQPLVNRRRQKEPGLAVDRPEVAHRRNVLEKRSKRPLS